MLHLHFLASFRDLPDFGTRALTENSENFAEEYQRARPADSLHRDVVHH